MKKQNGSLDKIINPSARERILTFVQKPYKLDKTGSDFVIRSNKELPETYFEHLLFPVTTFWNGYFESKLNLMNPARKDTMVDVCCGTGTLCLNAMPQMGFAKCIAIDNSEVAINVLEERIQPDQNLIELYEN